MDGRRMTRKNQKYNPLFILFLCLVAAVIVLLIVSIVLGARLGAANKKLKASEMEVQELRDNVKQLNTQIAENKTQTPEPAGPSTDEPALPLPGINTGDETGSATTPAEGGSWLDLTGHSEVKVKPTQLLDGFTTNYTTAGVNMRTGPGTDYSRIDTIDYGEPVQVAARENGWSFVKVNGKFGWINSDYLSGTMPAAAQQESRTEATSGSIRR